MRQQPILITLGIAQIIILTLFGLYFYRLKQNISQEVPKTETPVNSKNATIPDETNQEKNNKECQRGGCSGQLCTAEGDAKMTTCEFKPEYACYQEARCERQSDGSCGFTETDALKQCLKKTHKSSTFTTGY